MDTEKPLPESVFARGWRDTKRIFHSVGFWAVEVIGGGLLAGLANWWVALIFVVGMVLGSTLRAPHAPQLNYAKNGFNGWRLVFLPKPFG